MNSIFPSDWTNGLKYHLECSSVSAPTYCLMVNAYQTTLEGLTFFSVASVSTSYHWLLLASGRPPRVPNSKVMVSLESLRSGWDDRGD